MTSKEELEKMTVAQIKEKLKSRKLPTSGTKSDLIARLFDSLVTEEKLLGESGPGGDNIDLSNVNVDEVLGLDDEKDSALSSASPPKQNDSLLSLGSPDSYGGDKSRNTTAEAKKPDTPIKKPKPIISMGTVQPKTGNSAESGLSSQTDGEEAATKNDGEKQETDVKAQPAPIDDEKKVQLKMAARLGVPLAESEAKAKRSARFGNGTAAAAAPAAVASNEEEMKVKRAARFGGGGAISTEEVSSERKPVTEEDGKMLVRAERFGLPLKRGAAAAESNSSSVVVSDEVLEKRAKRFGISISAAAGGEDTKKDARAKRFGL